MISSLTISNSLSKFSLYEGMTMYEAAHEDEEALSGSLVPSRSITNEEIRKDDLLLETYRVDSEAINGGMGSVWKVTHKGWNRQLAMKRPQPRFFAEAGEQRKKAFIEECENWIRLGLHTNIVTCYYVREIGGVPTIFSEWMEKGSLTDVIRNESLYRGSNSEVQERLLDIAIQTASGLLYAHKKGLVHQDVKPGNILLSAKWEAKAADFGLAKVVNELSAEISEKSAGSAPKTVGYTPEYCPKEQTEGGEAKAWMDVYAWALTVLEMYLGRRIWATGADAYAVLTGGEQHSFRFRPPQNLYYELVDCIGADRENKEFSWLISFMTERYKILTGRPYQRPIFGMPEKTPAFLNNRALSYLDLGQTEYAHSLLSHAFTLQNGNRDVVQNNLLILEGRLGIRSIRDPFAFVTMERGDARNTWDRIARSDDYAGSDTLKTNSELGYYYDRLTKILKDPKDPIIRDYEGTAGYMFDGKLLLGTTAKSKKDRFGIPQTMKLRSIDLSTGKTERIFDSPPLYVFGKEQYQFTHVGKVCMSAHRKYAFAVNMNMQPNLTGRNFSYQRQRQEYLESQPNYFKRPWNRAAGVHVWDASSGKYLKYLPTDDIPYEGLEGLWADADDDEIVTAGQKKWNVATGESSQCPKRQDIVTEYAFPDGFTVKVTDKRSASFVEIRRGDEVISRYGGGQISVDPEKGFILDAPYDESHSGYHYSRRYGDKVVLTKICRIEYTAPLLLDKIETSSEFYKEYQKAEKADDAAREAEALLKAGDLKGALEQYEFVRDYYSFDRGYSEKRANLGWQFSHKAYPDAYYIYNASKAESVQRIRLQKDRQKLDAKLGDLLFRIIPCETEGTGADEIEHAKLSISSEKASGTVEWDLPTGTVESAFLFRNAVYCAISKPIVRDTAASSALDKRSVPPEEAVKRRIIANECAMYRISLTNGAAEKIGEGIKGSGSIVFNGKGDVIPSKAAGKAPQVIYETGASVWKPKELPPSELAISYDARIVISDDLYVTDCRWIMPKELPLPELLSIDNGFEEAKQNLKEEGIIVYEPGELEELRKKRGKGGFLQKLFGRNK